MIELQDDALVFRFPDVHEDAVCRISFNRTLRMPDDNNAYALPPSLGNFPLQHVDDYAQQVPASWLPRGGVFLPMYQSEAMWISFSSDYPCAVKIATGKINAVSGAPWSSELLESEEGVKQDYVILPDQPWLDGYAADNEMVRQFVAMPLGAGFTAEEQITGKAEHGGVQIMVYPMKAEVYEERRILRVEWLESHLEENFHDEISLASPKFCCQQVEELGLAPGGLIEQEIYEDEEGIDAWDQTAGSRCFVHIQNSEAYATITGKMPPQQPPTAQEYEKARLPWFNYYSEKPGIDGSDTLATLKSVAAMHVEKGLGTLPDNTSVTQSYIKTISEGSVVREGEF